MASRKFKLGTRVKVVRVVADSRVVLGKTGIVRDRYNDRSIGVMFPGWFEGHDLNGMGKNRGKHGGWYVAPSTLIEVAPRKKLASDVIHNGKVFRVVRKGKKAKR